MIIRTAHAYLSCCTAAQIRQEVFGGLGLGLTEAALAHRWGAWLTSSVAMKRVYAITRSMEGAQHMALSREMIA
jgi:hypothetical protein